MIERKRTTFRSGGVPCVGHVYRAPCGEVRQYPYGHFDFYREEVRRRVVADQVGFLKAHLVSTRVGDQPLASLPNQQQDQ